MKCDELERHTLDVWEDMSMYEPLVKASDVDAAIDELKTEHHKERDEYISMVNSREQTIKELKAKLESAQASMYADVVDANMENRRLRRALWIARAERAKTEHLSKIMYSTLFRDFIEKWVNVERKCRAKAESYL